MARLTALVWAVVLVSVVLGDKLPPGSGTVYPLVKISCRENPNLNMAVVDNKVVLAKANLTDPRQNWAVEYPDGRMGTDDRCERPFQIYNMATRQVLVIPKDGSLELKLAPYNTFNLVMLQYLWVKGPQLPDGYFQIRVFRDESLSLNGLYQPIHDGTTLGIYYSDPITDNAVWKITSL